MQIHLKQMEKKNVSSKKKRCYKEGIELMNWKNIINIIKNSLNGFGSHMEIKEKIVSESKDRIKIVQSEHQKEKKINRVSGTCRIVTDYLLLPWREEKEYSIKKHILKK